MHSLHVMYRFCATFSLMPYVYHVLPFHIFLYMHYFNNALLYFIIFAPHIILYKRRQDITPLPYVMENKNFSYDIPCRHHHPYRGFLPPFLKTTHFNMYYLLTNFHTCIILIMHYYTSLYLHLILYYTSADKISLHCHMIWKIKIFHMTYLADTITPIEVFCHHFSKPLILICITS